MQGYDNTNCHAPTHRGLQYNILRNAAHISAGKVKHGETPLHYIT